MNPTRRDVSRGALAMAGSSMLIRPGRAQEARTGQEAGTGQEAPVVPGSVDCHAHVFRRDLPLADARRYAPDYDATPEAYRAMRDANGIAQGVLVQPSFYGTDNRYLLEALARDPQRLRGIAVVAPGIAPHALRALDGAGIVGIRLNLIGQPDPDFGAAPWPDLLARLAALDWQVEVQAEARRWFALLDPLLGAGVTVVADHFGKPDPALGVDDPGFRHLLARGRGGRVWVKLSGSYRNGPGETGERIARAALPLLKDYLGLARLVWGSDWPHTQFERVARYGQVRAQLDAWLPDPAERRVVLVDAPRALFRLPKVPA